MFLSLPHCPGSVRYCHWASTPGGTYAALQRAAIHIVPVHIAYGHSGILVRVHLDKRKASVGLEPGLDDVAKVLEQRHDFGRRRVRRQVADVDGGLPVRGLAQYDFVASGAVGGELVVAERGRRRQAHRRHCLLLGDGWLALLVGPVAADGPGSEPLAVHGAESLLRIGAVSERDESIPTRSASFHIPHDASLGDRSEGRESLCQDLVVDLVGQIAHEDVEVVRRILLVGGIGLVSPVDADFLYPGSANLHDKRCLHGLVLPIGAHVCRSGSASRARPHPDRRIQRSRS